MRINLEENEIHQAIREYIELQGISLVKKIVEIKLKAGRGKNGHKAQIDILPTTEVTTEPATEETDSSGSKKEQAAILFSSEEE